MTQEQLNNTIAEELNKWQPILEYGRIYLDEDKAIRDRYKWLVIIKEHWTWGLALTLIEGIVSFISKITILYILLCIFLVMTIAVIVVIYINRETISSIVNEKVRTELEVLLDKTNSYLSSLGRWLAELDSHKKLSSQMINQIEKEFIKANATQLPNENKFSRIHGNINPEWEERAKNYADKRLQPYKLFLYE